MFRALHESLSRWAAASSGLPPESVFWHGQAVGEVYAPLCELQIIGVRQNEPDTVTRTDPGDGSDLTEQQCGMRTVLVQVRFRTRDYDPDTFALALAERAKASLMGSEMLDAMLAEGVSVIGAGDARIMPTGYRGRIEQEALFELSCVISVHTPVGTVGWFDRVRVTSELATVLSVQLPVALQLQDEEIGPP